jgi:sulfite exporter TauE/SafE
MSLLLAMLPVYFFGNLHCLGMCGPLVAMIGQHRFRFFYFLGRLFSFTLAGTIAGGAGAVLAVFLNAYHLSAGMSFIFGGIIFLIGIYTLLGKQYPGQLGLAKILAPFNRSISLLMLRDQPWPTFLFGFFTVALPCGQTLFVFSACALSGDMDVGFINGLAFAVLTSPSLFLAMNAHALFRGMKQYYNTIMGACALLVGFLAICRGLAEVDLIPHLILNPQSSAHFHIVIF